MLYPSHKGRVPIDVILRTDSYAAMHPIMRERVRALIEASEGQAGFGEGLRTEQAQLQMFLARHVVDPNGKITYNGQRWRLAKGAAAAPPGRSMHEIGLAADLRGVPTANKWIDDFTWVGANVAKFGLKTFAEVNGEPWHVQPVELPNGRSHYEAKGAAWGKYPQYRGASSETPRHESGGVAPESSTSVTDVATRISAAGLTPALVATPGDSGPAARVLIEAMIGRGLLPDEPSSRSGTYGPDKVEIVRQFQRDNGLGVDGEVGVDTWGKMLKQIDVGENSPMVLPLKAVLIVRSLIKDSAANMGTDYGPMTEQRVKEFQAVSGLEAIGRVGPQTWTALLGAKRRIQVSERGDEIDEDEVSFDHIDLDDIDRLEIYEGRSA